MDDCSSGRLLSESAIRKELDDRVSGSADLHLHLSLPSTNSFLLRSTAKQAFEICATEQQTGGRGRRGKAWHTPERGVTFSMKMTVPLPLAQIGGASLVTGVAVCEMFRSFGIPQAAVKWPNDILVSRAKLAGILVEIAAHSERTTTLVVGIGVNYRTGPEKDSIDRETIDLQEALQGDLPDRSTLIGKICNRVFKDLTERLPLQRSFLANWSQYDALAGQMVRVFPGAGSASDAVAGRVSGIDSRGYLALETDRGMRFFASAEVSIGSQAAFD